MSVISVGTFSSLVSLGIMAKPPTAYRKPPIDNRLRELRSWGNSVNSDHLEHNRKIIPPTHTRRHTKWSDDGVKQASILLYDTQSSTASAILWPNDLLFTLLWVISLLWTDASPHNDEIKWSYKTTVVSLVAGNVVDLRRAGEAFICDPRNHKDLVFVDSDSKQWAGLLQRSQVLPLKLGGVVDTDSLHAFPAHKHLIQCVKGVLHRFGTWSLVYSWQGVLLSLWRHGIWQHVPCFHMFVCCWSLINNPDDVIRVISVGNETVLWGFKEVGIQEARTVKWKMQLSCIMGIVGSSVFGT